MTFYGRYKYIRECLDYTFHKIYDRERQLFQDRIIQSEICFHNGSSVKNPKLYLTAGAMGSGKTHSIKKLLGKSFPQYVLADVDRIKNHFPEARTWDPYTVGQALHSEACTIHEILFREAIYEKKHVIIDSSLRNGEFFRDLLIKWKSSSFLYEYEITIVHVIASLETCLRRADKRAKDTGRIVPKESIEQSIEQCPKSIKLLEPLVTNVITFFNDIDDT